MQCDTEACSQNGTLKLFVQITVGRRGDIGLPKHRQSLNKTEKSADGPLQLSKLSVITSMPQTGLY